MISPDHYRALRERAGLLDLATRGRLLLSGEDRRTYLHGLLTNDIAGLTAGGGCYAALLTAQGRMVADMRVFELGDALLLDLDGTVAPAVRDRFEQFIFSEDVQVKDVAAAWTEAGVYGPLAADVVSRALVSLGSGPTAGAQLGAMEIYGNIRVPLGDAFTTVVRSDELGVSGFDLFIPIAQSRAVLGALRASGAVDVSAETADVCRIENGRPLYGVDMDNDTIPLEAGIQDRAISLTKGCYVGQEIIIRVLHRGQGRVARRLVGLALEPGALVPVRGDRIRSGERELGAVTSAAASPVLGRPIALGYVHRDFVEEGTTLTVGDQAAVVRPLPFVSSQTSPVPSA